MDIDFESIKKLPPERRKTALKEVSNMLEQEIAQVKKQLEETERLLLIAETEESILEEIAVPEAKKVEVRELFLKREGLSLDEQLKQLPDQERQAVQQLSKAPIEDIYQKVKDIYSAGDETAIRETEERTRDIYALAIAAKREAVERGEYAIGEKAEHLMTAAEKLTYKRL